MSTSAKNMFKSSTMVSVAWRASVCVPRFSDEMGMEVMQIIQSLGLGNQVAGGALGTGIWDL